MKTFVQAADNGSPLLSNLDGTRVFRLELITVESRLFEPVARVHAIQCFFYYYYYFFSSSSFSIRQRETFSIFSRFLPQIEPRQNRG